MLSRLFTLHFFLHNVHCFIIIIYNPWKALLAKCWKLKKFMCICICWFILIYIIYVNHNQESWFEHAHSSLPDFRLNPTSSISMWILIECNILTVSLHNNELPVWLTASRLGLTLEKSAAVTPSLHVYTRSGNWNTTSRSSLGSFIRPFNIFGSNWLWDCGCCFYPVVIHTSTLFIILLSINWFFMQMDHSWSRIPCNYKEQLISLNTIKNNYDNWFCACYI